MLANEHEIVVPLFGAAFANMVVPLFGAEMLISLCLYLVQQMLI